MDKAISYEEQIKQLQDKLAAVDVKFKALGKSQVNKIQLQIDILTMMSGVGEEIYLIEKESFMFDSLRSSDGIMK